MTSNESMIPLILNNDAYLNLKSIEYAAPIMNLHISLYQKVACPYFEFEQGQWIFWTLKYVKHLPCLVSWLSVRDP